MATLPLLVGVDVGTTNIKALVFEPDGGIVGQASVSTPTHYPQPNWAYYDPDELWGATVSALKGATAQLSNPQHIVSIGISSFGETSVFLDAHDQPTYHAIAWFDQRTQPQMAWLEAQIGADHLFALTGLPPLAIYGLCKVLWLKQNEPAAFARATRWLNGVDYVAFRLCGVAGTDYSLASRTFALDLRRQAWATDLLSEVGISTSLPAPLTPSGTSLGQVLPEVAQATGLPAHTQVALGGHDHIVGAFALGINTPDKLLNSLGTAEAIFLPLETPFTDPEVGRQGYSQGLLQVQERGAYYAMGGLYTSGGSIEWLREAMSGVDRPEEQPDYATLIAEAAQVPPGSLGVSFLPYLRLAGPPYVDGKARGAFIGLSTDAKRGALFRAVLEGVAYDMRLSLETLLAHQAGTQPPKRQIIATGGGTRNPLWMQIKATILNQPIEIVDITEAVTLGAALMGGLGAGVYPDIDTALQAVHYQQKQVQPQPEYSVQYNRLYEQVYCQIYPALRSLHHTICDLAGSKE